MPTRQREIISPHTRGIIVKKIAAGKPWKGSRAGFRIEVKEAKQFRLLTGTPGQPATTESSRIEWRMRIDHEWQHGTAETIWEAVQAIHTKAAEVAARSVIQ